MDNKKLSLEQRVALLEKAEKEAAGILNMYQELIFQLWDRIDTPVVTHTAAGSRQRNNGKPCKLCGVNPREDGRVVCLRCFRQQSLGIG